MAIPLNQDQYMENEIQGKPQMDMAEIDAESLLKEYAGLKQSAWEGNKAVADLPQIVIDQAKTQIKGESTKPADIELPGGSKSHIEFHENGKIKSAHITSPNKDVKDIAYWDTGKPKSVSMTSANGEKQDYAYDLEGRLLSKDRKTPDGTTEHSEYGPNGKPNMAQAKTKDGNQVYQEYHPSPETKVQPDDKTPVFVELKTSKGYIDQYSKGEGETLIKRVNPLDAKEGKGDNNGWKGVPEELPPPP